MTAVQWALIGVVFGHMFTVGVFVAAYNSGKQHHKRELLDLRAAVALYLFDPRMVDLLDDLGTAALHEHTDRLRRCLYAIEHKPNTEDRP